MKFPTSKLWRIEKDIINLKKNLLKNEDQQFYNLSKKKVEVSNLESAIRMVTSEMRSEIEVLELERKFILDRRNSLFWRIIWNILIPITVSVGTVYLLNYLGLRPLN